MSIAAVLVAATSAVAQAAGAATMIDRSTIDQFEFSSPCTGENLVGRADVLSVFDFSGENDPTHPFFHLAQTYEFSLAGESSGMQYTGIGHMTEVFSGRFFVDAESGTFVEPITIVLRSTEGPNLIFKSRTVTVVTPDGHVVVNLDHETADCM